MNVKKRSEAFKTLKKYKTVYQNADIIRVYMSKRSTKEWAKRVALNDKKQKGMTK